MGRLMKIVSTDQGDPPAQALEDLRRRPARSVTSLRCSTPEICLMISMLHLLRREMGRDNLDCVLMGRCFAVYGLAYECQRQNPRDRGLSVATKIRRRLGGG